MDNFGWELSMNYNGDDWRNSNISGDKGVDERSINKIGDCGKPVEKLWKICG